MILKRTFSGLLCLQLSGVLTLASFGPSAFAADSCKGFLTRIYKLRERMTQPDLQAKSPEEQVIAMFQALPKAFIAEHRDKIFGYLYRYSQRTDTLEILISVYQSMVGRKSSFDKSQVQTNCTTAAAALSPELEFSIRIHPSLHEILKFFLVDGVAADGARAEMDKRQIIDQLKDLDPLEKQIVIRSALDDLMATKPAHISSYAAIVLIEAASEISAADTASATKADKRLVKQAQRLARNIGQLVDSDDLGYDAELSNEQLHEIVMQDVENNNLQKRRLWIALRQVFLKKDYHVRPFTIISGAATALSLLGSVYLWAYSGDFDPVSYYSLPNSMLVFIAGALGTKFMLQYLDVISQGLHPMDGYDKDNNPILYLKDESDQRTQIILRQLKGKTFEVLKTLSRPSTAPVVASPININTSGAPIAALTPDTSASALVSSALLVKGDSSADGAQIPLKPPEAPVISVEDVQQRLQAQAAPKVLQPTVSADVREAGQRFSIFFQESARRVAERDSFVDGLATGFLMPDSVNIQVLSESGVGKTAVTKFIFEAIKDAQGLPSVFLIQMGKDTTIDDLMGPVKPSEIRNDRIVRAVENGLPGKYLAFFDEHYRAMIYTREALLEFQANGSVSLAGTTYDSKNIMSVYASNKYPNLVFLRDGKDAQAEMDRMLFTYILPPIFEKDSHMIKLRKIDGTNMPLLTFDDIFSLRAMTALIPETPYFHSKIKLLVNRLRSRVMIEEHESEMNWHRRSQAGEILLTGPEYNTRVLSPRSEAVAQNLLIRFAVYDWIKAGMPGDHPPEATEAHFAQLERFFVPISSPTPHLQRVMKQYGEGSPEYQEFRQIVNSRTEYHKTITAIDEEISKTAELLELQRFGTHLGVKWTSLNGAEPMPTKTFAVTKENVEVVNNFLKWREALVKSVENQPEIVEVQAQDVGRDLAVHLSNKLLTYLQHSGS